MSNRAINEHAYLVAYERQKICGDLPETTAFKSYAAKQERKSQLLIYRLTHGQLSLAGQPYFPTCTHARMTSGRGSPHFSVRTPPPTCHTRMRARRKNTAGPRDYGQLSPLDAQRNVRSYPGIVNDIQSCPKQCLLMLLARVGARKLTAPSVQLQRGAWPNSAHAYWHTYVQ